MREQGAAARGLPFQLRPQPPGVDCDQNQIRLPGKMLICGLGELTRGGEMDEAIAGVVSRSAKRPLRLGGMQQPPLANFVDCRHPRCLDSREPISAPPAAIKARSETRKDTGEGLSIEVINSYHGDESSCGP